MNLKSNRHFILRLALVAALLSSAGAGQAWADSWGLQSGIKSGAWGLGDGTSHCIYYNGLSGPYNWGGSSTQSGSHGGDLALFNQGTSIAGTVQIEMAIYNSTRTIPSYSRLVRTATFTTWFASNRHHHGGGLYLFDDYNTAINTWVDCTYTQCRNSDAGENYKILKTWSSNTSGTHDSASGSRSMTYDNYNVSTDRNITKYLAFEHPLGNHLRAVRTDQQRPHPVLHFRKVIRRHSGARQGCDS